MGKKRARSLARETEIETWADSVMFSFDRLQWEIKARKIDGSWVVDLRAGSGNFHVRHDLSRSRLTAPEALALGKEWLVEKLEESKRIGFPYPESFGGMKNIR